MKDIFKYFILTILVVGLCLSIFTYHKDKSFGVLQWRYIDYKFFSPKDSYVVFGPSYAAYLQFDKPFYNLGIPGSRPMDHLETLKRIKTSSTPVYVCSMREVAFVNIAKQKISYDPFSRALWTVKQTVLKREYFRDLDQKKFIYNVRQHLNESGADHFQRIKKLRPDTIFVLTPFQVFDEDLQTDFERMLISQNIQVINLTRLYQDDAFKNSFHVTLEDRMHIAKIIESLYVERN